MSKLFSVHHWRDEVWRHLFPTFCLGCGGEGAWICERCEVSRPPTPIQRCINCRTVAPFGATCLSCRRRTEIDGLVVRGLYRSWLWRDLIRSWKYRGGEDLGRRAGEYLVESLSFLPVQHDALIVPVPLARRRERARGFNQAAVLAEAVARQLGAKLSPVLVRQKETAPQAKLSTTERHGNVRGAFRCTAAAAVQGKTCVLIDDIVTTGATLNAAATALKESGAGAVWGLALVRSEIDTR